jgi:hypothetical protein
MYSLFLIVSNVITRTYLPGTVTCKCPNAALSRLVYWRSFLPVFGMYPAPLLHDYRERQPCSPSRNTGIVLFKWASTDFQIITYMTFIKQKTNSVGLSPQANYTDWATATWRNLVPTFADKGVSSGGRGGPPTVVNLSCVDRSRYFSFS